MPNWWERPQGQNSVRRDYYSHGWGAGGGQAAPAPWEAEYYGRKNIAAKNSDMNPWQRPFQDAYGRAANDPYQGQWRNAVSQAMSLGNRNFEGDMRRFANEDITAQQNRASNQLGSMGMRELMLRGDVQTDWAKRRQDAMTRATMDAQQMKQSALESMRGMLGSASGADLDRIGAMISAAAGGGGNYNQFASLLLPLIEKYAQYGSPGGTNLMRLFGGK